MKKMLSVFLALTMMLSLAACGGNSAPETETTEPSASVEAPASALEILENTWANFSEEEKFAIYGGAFETHVAKMSEDEAYQPASQPENYDMAYAQGLSYGLYIPVESVASVEEAATMTHMMNANTFSAGVIRLSADTDVQALGDTMKDVLMNNMWLCGAPEQLLIAVVGSDYMVIGFGVNDAMNSFVTHFAEAYPAAQILYNEPITN